MLILKPSAREQAPALSGSFDNGDPQTTNIHVSSLPQNVTEQSLGMLFARYGPVGSVKVRPVICTRVRCD